MRRTGRLLLVVSLIAGLMAFGNPAQAEELEYVVRGELQNDLFDVAAAGDQVVISYSVESTTPDLDSDPEYGDYPGALTSFQITAGDYVAVADLTTGRNGVFVENSFTDSLHVSLFSNFQGSEIDGYQLFSVSFSLRDGDGDSLDSDVLNQPIEGLQRLIENDEGRLGSDEITLSFSQCSGSLCQTLRPRAAVDSIELVGDEIPPTASASLVPIEELHDDKGTFRVEYSCTDDSDPSPIITSAQLNGVDLPNGQIVELKVNDETKIEEEDDVLEMKAPSFELIVTCEDESGNVGTASTTPDFAEGGDDE